MSRPRLSIRNRLLALGLIPLLALVALSAISLRGVVSERGETQELVRLVGLSTRLANLVHTMQGERGMTSGFVSSKGATMADTLPQARKATDQATAEVTQFLAEHGTLPADVRAAAGEAMTSVQGAVDQRASADAYEKPAPEYVAAYTKPVNELLEALASVTYATNDADMTRDLGALAALASAKESAGLERAQLTTVFATNSFAPGQEARVTGLLNQRLAYLSTFVLLGGAEVRAEVDTLNASAPAKEVAALEQKALGTQKDFGVDPKAWFSTATSYIDGMRALEVDLQHHVSEQAADLASAATRTVALWAAAVVLIVAGTLAVLWWTLRAIMASLRRIEIVLAGLREGRLDERVEILGEDEITDMGISLNSALDAVEPAMASIRRASRDLRDAAGQLSGVAVELQTTSSASAQQAEGVSSSADDVSRDVDSLAGAGEELKFAIREISQSASAAQTIVDNAVSSAQEEARTVSELEQSSARIDDVLKTVAAISEQTNLLALNATIEAARAGEAGKGFAVVANEVKELAQETTRATEDIARRVEQLRTDTRAATARIDEVGSTVAEMSSVQAAIAAAVEEQTATTHSIGDHVGQAASGTRAIATRVQEVAAMARRADASAGTTQTSAESLEALSTQLSGIVDRFRVRG